MVDGGSVVDGGGREVVGGEYLLTSSAHRTPHTHTHTRPPKKPEYCALPRKRESQPTSARDEETRQNGLENSHSENVFAASPKRNIQLQ